MKNKMRSGRCDNPVTGNTCLIMLMRWPVLIIQLWLFDHRVFNAVNVIIKDIKIIKTALKTINNRYHTRQRGDQLGVTIQLP